MTYVIGGIVMDLKKYVADIPDFPQKGIIFRDVTPMLQDGEAFAESIRQITDFAKNKNIDIVVGPEARGFLYGCPTAISLNAGFAPVRKPGKLPRETVSRTYDLEYGSNEIFMHKDSIKPGQKVLLVDDLLATGGTVKAAIELVEEMGGEVAGCAFVIELLDLHGRDLLEDYDIFSILTY